MRLSASGPSSSTVRGPFAIWRQPKPRGSSTEKPLAEPPMMPTVQAQSLVLSTSGASSRSHRNAFTRLEPPTVRRRLGRQGEGDSLEVHRDVCSLPSGVLRVVLGRLRTGCCPRGGRGPLRGLPSPRTWSSSHLASAWNASLRCELGALRPTQRWKS